MVSLYLDTVRLMIMTYMLLLHCLHPYLLQLSFVIILIMSLLTTYYYKIQYIYLLAEITLKLELQSTEDTSHIKLMHFLFFYYNVRRSVLFKIHADNIEASKFFVLFFVGDHGKLFLKISQMLVVCICYCYNFHIFLRE